MSIPSIREPITHEIIIQEINFNFNDLLEYEVLATAHEYYLFFVDVILFVGFVYLLINKFEEVFKK